MSRRTYQIPRHLELSSHTLLGFSFLIGTFNTRYRLILLSSINAPMEKVWNLFMDPTQLCRVIPGCEQARQLDETHYEAVLSVKVQFMTIRSNARGTSLKAEPPQHLVVEMMGEPVAMAGAFRAQVTI